MTDFLWAYRTHLVVGVGLGGWCLMLMVCPRAWLGTVEVWRG